MQLTTWLIDGLIRYEDLLDDWWDVDERSGVIRGQRTGRRIRIGDTAKVRIVRVDPPRRELSLAIAELQSQSEKGPQKGQQESKKKTHRKGKSVQRRHKRR